MRHSTFGLRTVVISAGAFLLSIASANAIGNGVTVSGTVLGLSGQVLPALVTIVDSGGLTREVPVDAHGNFAAVGFQPGVIVFRVRTGSTAAGTAAISIPSNRSARCDFTVDPPDGATAHFLSVPEPTCELNPSTSNQINI